MSKFISTTYTLNLQLGITITFFQISSSHLWCSANPNLTYQSLTVYRSLENQLNLYENQIDLFYKDTIIVEL